MTKRELLLAICELPGWQPAQPVSTSVERGLKELKDAGLILGRLDGWEATSTAIDAYPVFEGHPDLFDADAVAPAPPSPAPQAHPHVVALFYLLLQDKMTIATGERLVQAAREHTPGESITDRVAGELAALLLS